MTRLARRLTIVAAALVAVAQVVVAPASCCLIRGVLSGWPACHAADAIAAADAQSCCHGRAADAEHMAIGHRLPGPVSGECLWCSAGPKVVSGDRVAVPYPGAGASFVSSAVVEPAAETATTVEFVTDEPFHRTAPATCAWLCVWRK